jgi:ribose/xylose/arabinose/galactoside ABC-type transport system permease subunit
MTYGDQAFRFRGEGFRDEGFRDEPDFRPENPTSTPLYRPGTYNPDDYASPTDTTNTLSRGAVSTAELDDVFDDPQLGDPGMDRMAVHVLWEIVLAMATIALALWLYHSHRAGVSGAGLRTLLLSAAMLGFLTIGVGLSLRAGAVNLAVGPIAAGSALFLVTHVDRGLGPTIGITLVLAAGVGAAVGLLIVVLHVPAWASSLAVSFAVIVWIQRHTIPTQVSVSYQPSRHAFYWYGGFAALALLGGFLGLVKPIRRGLGRFRPVADPAQRRGTGAAVVAFLALVGSSLLAGLAGVLAAASGDLTGVVAPGETFVTTGLALGAALVGGTSVFGRRGGVFGSLLSATLLALAISYAGLADLRVSPYALTAGTIAAGLVVSRLVEAFGRPYSARAEPAEEDPWVDRSRVDEAAGGATPGYPPPRQGGWTSQLPARANDDTWGGTADNRWRAR